MHFVYLQSRIGRRNFSSFSCILYLLFLFVDGKTNKFITSEKNAGIFILRCLIFSQVDSNRIQKMQIWLEPGLQSWIQQIYRYLAPSSGGDGHHKGDREQQGLAEGWGPLPVRGLSQQGRRPAPEEPRQAKVLIRDIRIILRDSDPK